MDEKIEYREDFERSGYDTIEDAKAKIKAVVEFYSEKPGWVIGEPKITQQFDGKYKVSIPLTKYEVENKRSR